MDKGFKPLLRKYKIIRGKCRKHTARYSHRQSLPRRIIKAQAAEPKIKKCGYIKLRKSCMAKETFYKVKTKQNKMKQNKNQKRAEWRKSLHSTQQIKR